MSAENTVKSILSNIVLFIQSTFGENAAVQLNARLQDWPSTWRSVKVWLTDDTKFTRLLGWKDVLLDFANTLPEFYSFEKYFKESLNIHDEFWSNVFQCVILAHKQLEQEQM